MHYTAPLFLYLCGRWLDTEQALCPKNTWVQSKGLRVYKCNPQVQKSWSVSQETGTAKEKFQRRTYALRFVSERLTGNSGSLGSDHFWLRSTHPSGRRRTSKCGL